jgi:hypothetical protein
LDETGRVSDRADLASSCFASVREKGIATVMAALAMSGESKEGTSQCKNARTERMDGSNTSLIHTTVD